ncbi:hypothetical protein DFH06DRAFT_1118554 [Mycena polygramma]|nr:hypothetical protein DFH06DRAFT_1118554 [Mycena polygramma]
MFDVHVLAAEQKVCITFVTYVLMFASHRKRVREQVLDAMEVVKADAQEGLVSDSPGSMEFRKKLKTDASQLTKMVKISREPRKPPAGKDSQRSGATGASFNKDVGQDNGANVVKAQHRIGSLFKRAQNPPVDITEYLASFDSAVACEDKMRACDWEDLAFARILRGYEGAEEGNAAEKWKRHVGAICLHKNTRTDFYKRAFMCLPEVESRFQGRSSYEQEQILGKMEAEYGQWKGKMKFVVAARSKLLELFNKFGATIFINPFWTVDNLHQNRQSKEFGVFFNLLLDELPKEDELTVNLARYEPSREAALGILRAIDVEIASEVEALLDEEIGDYGRLCQELEADVLLLHCPVKTLGSRAFCCSNSFGQWHDRVIGVEVLCECAAQQEERNWRRSEWQGFGSRTPTRAQIVLGAKEKKVSSHGSAHGTFGSRTRVQCQKPQDGQWFTLFTVQAAVGPVCSAPMRKKIGVPLEVEGELASESVVEPASSINRGRKRDVCAIDRQLDADFSWLNLAPIPLTRFQECNVCWTGLQGAFAIN